MHWMIVVEKVKGYSTARKVIIFWEIFLNFLLVLYLNNNIFVNVLNVTK